MKGKHFQKCALCRKKEELTFEHIPPRAAFNSSPAKPVTGNELINDDRMPWDTNGLKYTNQQRGMGLYSLCATCNNNTGSWYAKEYIDVAHVIQRCFKNGIAKDGSAVVINEFYPQRFIKQVISMFCSINNYEDERFDELRNFVLNKNLKGLNKSKYRICYYFTESLLCKYAPLSVIMKMDGKAISSIVLSEITAYPLGFVLYFVDDASTKYDGIDITFFSDYGYDDIASATFPFCIKEMNDIFPGHYRSKDEIVKCFEENRNQGIDDND